MAAARFRFVGGLVLGSVLATGVAWAAIPSTTGAVITACMKRSSGEIRLIDAQAGKKCSNNEQTVTWNQTGPQGPAGATGAAGAQGPAGPAGSGDRCRLLPVPHADYSGCDLRKIGRAHV